MKTPKLLFAVAIVFAALSFSFKAKAQTTAEVTLQFSDDNWDPAPRNGIGWNVWLSNVDTYEDYSFDSWDSDEVGYQEYEMGDVPVGHYTIALTYYSYVDSMHIDWFAGNSTDAMQDYGMLMGASGWDILLEDDNHPDGVLNVTSDGLYFFLSRI